MTYSDYTVTFGIANEGPFNGDWIGQGHDGVGVINGSSGLTFERNSLTTGFADQTLYYGTTGDIPVAGHWGVSPFTPLPPRHGGTSTKHSTPPYTPHPRAISSATNAEPGRRGHPPLA